MPVAKSCRSNTFERLRAPNVVFGIVDSAGFRIPQHPVSLGQFQKTLHVAGLGVIRVAAAGQNPVDPLDGFGLRFGTDLHQFVVVAEDRACLDHLIPPVSAGTRCLMITMTAGPMVMSIIEGMMKKKIGKISLTPTFDAFSSAS